MILIININLMFLHIFYFFFNLYMLKDGSYYKHKFNVSMIVAILEILFLMFIYINNLSYISI